MFVFIYYLYLALIDFYIHMHFLNWIKMTYFLEQILNPRVTCFFMEGVWYKHRGAL